MAAVLIGASPIDTIGEVARNNGYDSLKEEQLLAIASLKVRFLERGVGNQQTLQYIVLDNMAHGFCRGSKKGKSLLLLRYT